jgi:hypothetical protein
MPTNLGASPKIINSYVRCQKLGESVALCVEWWPFALLEMTTLFIAVLVERDPGALWPIPYLIGP